MRLVLLLLLAGCAYVEATTTQYAGVEKYAPADAASVKVLAHEPRGRHDRLGEVIVYASLDPAPTVDDIEKRMQQEAAKWGANAVYIVRDLRLPARGERQLVGIAIRLR
jgi:hypothetical protein